MLFIFLELELFVKIKNDLVSTQSQKSGLSKTQDLNKMKKNLAHLFAEIDKMEACVKL